MIDFYLYYLIIEFLSFALLILQFFNSRQHFRDRTNLPSHQNFGAAAQAETRRALVGFLRRNKSCRDHPPDLQIDQC